MADRRSFKGINLFKLKKKQQPTKATKRYVKKELAALGERKYTWLSTDGTPLQPIYTSATVNPLYRIADGTGESQRIGQKIQPTSLEVSFNMYRGNADSQVRVIFLRWNNSAAVLSATSVLEAANNGNLNFITAPFDLDKSRRKRFTVLSDKMFLLDDARQNGIHTKYNVKVNSKPILYETTSLSSPATGNIFMLIISDNVLATAPNVTYDIVGRYRDL